VDVVVRTAALKHVPLCEFNPIEAIKTNIDGTVNVIDAAIKNQLPWAYAPGYETDTCLGKMT
jgi:FlaA1/EpsC-like NDP-sugar epimerase